MELFITLAILIAAIVLFVTNKVRPDLVALMALSGLLLSGILNIQEALAGFANPTVIMLAGLFVVGGGIVRSGLADQAGQLLLKYAGNKETRLFILIMLVVAIVGCFISNSGTVAIMLPIVMSLAANMKNSPAKYLIPLAYGASFSGLMTLISTPTNLVISQVLQDYGFPKLGFFTITPLGIIAFSAGLIYLLLVRNTLLPKKGRKTFVKRPSKTPDQLLHQYNLEKRIHRIFVPAHSPLVKNKLKDLHLPDEYSLFVLKIERKQHEGLHLLPGALEQKMAGPDSTIEAEDILYIQGPVDQVNKFVFDYQLDYSPHSETEQLVSKTTGIVEVLLTPNSSLINRSVTESGFRKKYNLNVIGVNRKGQYLLKDVSQLRLRFGDALLVQGYWNELEFLAQDTRDVVVVGQPQEFAGLAAASGKAPVALAILIGMIILMILDIFPPVVPVILAAMAMIFTGCLRNMDDFYSQINWESIVLIAGMLPMGTALEKTGGMALIAETLIETLGDYGPLAVLAGVYVATAFIGQFMSNTATAVLFAPIAINAAIELGVNPLTFAMAVACAAGMPFANPIASPTNALVMTAGGFKYSDFLKTGLPLMAIMFVIMMIVIPIIYQF